MIFDTNDLALSGFIVLGFVIFVMVIVLLIAIFQPWTSPVEVDQGGDDIGLFKTRQAAQDFGENMIEDLPFSRDELSDWHVRVNETVNGFFVYISNNASNDVTKGHIIIHYHGTSTGKPVYSGQIGRRNIAHRVYNTGTPMYSLWPSNFSTKFGDSPSKALLSALTQSGIYDMITEQSKIGM